MYILENVPLNAYSTMRLGGVAAYLTDINSRQEIVEAVQWAEERGIPVRMIGGGSNIIWTDTGFAGLILVNKIQGIEVQEVTADERYVTAGGGVIWDELVAKTVELGLTGIEFLSMVPGTVGATPIQNVGAYGQEVSSTIITIEAYDMQAHAFVTLQGSDCGFGYRDSRFKSADAGRFIISSVTFFLTVGNPTPPYYASVEEYCQKHDIKVLTPATGRAATMAIRTAKLPDPLLVANSGSFFANPIVSFQQYSQLEAAYPDMPHWSTASGAIKVPAAWLIEQAGFKDFHDPETGMGTWPAQPLVLVNEHAHTTAQLLAFKQKIVGAVQQKFQITLTQEPEMLGADNS